MMEVLTQHIREGLPWKLLHVDDLMLIAESNNELTNRCGSNVWM